MPRLPHWDLTRFHVTGRGKLASSLCLFAVEVGCSVWLWQGYGIPFWLTWVIIQALTLSGRAHGVVMVNEQLTSKPVVNR